MTVNYISSPSRRKKQRFGPPPLLRPARKGEKTGTVVNFFHEHHRTHETPEREVFDSNPKHRVPETNDWQQLFSGENLSRDAFWSIDLVCVLVEGVLCGRFGGVVFSWYPSWGGFQEHRLFFGVLLFCHVFWGPPILPRFPSASIHPHGSWACTDFGYCQNEHETTKTHKHGTRNSKRAQYAQTKATSCKPWMAGCLVWVFRGQSIELRLGRLSPVFFGVVQS